jgi:hypothetical protein
METSNINFRIHFIFWILLTFFPAAVGANLSVAQRMMHLTLFAYLITCTVLFTRYKIACSRNLFELVILYVTLTGTYYGFVALYRSNTILTNAAIIDMIKPLVYLIYFFFPLLFPLTERQFSGIMKLIVLLCAFQIAFSMLVYYKEFWPVVDLYKGRKSGDIIIMHFFRWSGTYGYPQDFGFFLSFVLYYFLFSIKNGVYDKKIAITGLLAVIVALVATLSRGALVTVAVMLMPAMIMIKRIKGIFYYGVLLIVFVISVWIGINVLSEQMFNIEYVTDFLENGLNAKSTRHRAIELGLAWTYAGEYFPIGAGPDIARHQSGLPVLETLYGHYFMKWGVIGYLLYLGFVIYLAKVAYRLWRTSDNNVIVAASGASLLLIISVPLVIGFSAVITDRFKGLPFFYTLIGYLVMLDHRPRINAVYNDT